MSKDVPSFFFNELFDYLCREHCFIFSLSIVLGVMGELKDKYIRFDWAIKRLLRQKANFDVRKAF